MLWEDDLGGSVHNWSSERHYLKGRGLGGGNEDLDWGVDCRNEKERMDARDDIRSPWHMCTNFYSTNFTLELIVSLFLKQESFGNRSSDQGGRFLVL